MSVTGNLTAILAELTANQRHVDDAQASALVDAVEAARHLFVAGAGRSGIAIGGFANRLMHLGVSVSVVGEITSPHSAPGDLLIIGSGSGETGSLVALARRAHAAGVTVALVTTDPASTIGRLATVTVVLPGVSPKLATTAAITSVQPMGSAFEQLAFLTYDAIVLELMARRSETSESMFGRHADFE